MIFKAKQFEIGRKDGLYKNYSGYEVMESSFKTLYNEVQDPVIKQKIEKEIEDINIEFRKSEERNYFKRELLSGKSKHTIKTTEHLNGEKERTEVYNELMTSLVTSGDATNIMSAIKIDGVHGGGNIEYLNNLDEALTSSDVGTAAQSLALYLSTKDSYNYSQNSISKFSSAMAIGQYYKLDLSTKDGIDSLQNILKNPVDEKAVVSPADIADSNSFFKVDGLDADQTIFVQRKANEVAKYMSKEKAIEYGRDQLNKAFVTGSYAVGGVAIKVPFTSSSQPINLFGAKTSVDVDRLKFALNPSNPSGVDGQYNAGTDTWFMKIEDPDGNTRMQILTNDQLRQAMTYGQNFNKATDAVEALIEKKFGREVYVDGKDTEERIKNLDLYFKDVVGGVIKENKLFAGKSTAEKAEIKKAIEIEALEQYKDKIHDRAGFTQSNKSSEEPALGSETFGEVKSELESQWDYLADKVDVDSIKSFVSDKLSDLLDFGEKIIDTLGPSKAGASELKPTVESYTKSNLGEILKAEGGVGVAEGEMHRGAEVDESLNPNLKQTTKYGVVIPYTQKRRITKKDNTTKIITEKKAGFAKKANETDEAHATRYYNKRVLPKLKKVDGIENETTEVLNAISKYIWNKGSLPSGFDLKNESATQEGMLEITTTAGKQMNGTINRTISEYNPIAKAKGWGEVTKIRTVANPKNSSQFKIQYFDGNTMIHDDGEYKPRHSSANKNFVNNKEYDIVNNSIVTSTKRNY